MNVAAVILAAGASSRMGQPKQVLQVEGTSLIRRAALAALGSKVMYTVVVTGAAHDLVLAEIGDLPVRIVHNPDHQQGMSTSLRAGIQAVSADETVQAAIVMLADQPFVDSAVVNGLLELYAQTKARIARPRYAEQPGNPVLWDASLFDDLAAQTGDQGGRSLLQEHRSEIAWLDLPDPRVQLDVDTPEAYAALTKLLPGHTDTSAAPLERRP